jgi:hypothetical protein
VDDYQLQPDLVSLVKRPNQPYSRSHSKWAEIGDGLTMKTITFVPSETQNNILREQLAAGETVCWLGEEPRSRYITNRILGMVMPILVALFAGFFTLLMLMLNPNIFQGSLQGLVPVLIPLAIFCVAIYSLARAILAFVRGRPALYVVTDQRAVLIEQGGEVSVKSFGPDATQSMQIARRKNGSGKIIFERIASWERDGEGRSQRRVVEIGFFGLSSVDEVCRHLRQMARPEPSILLGGDALPVSEQSTLEPASAFYVLETSALHEYLYKVSIVSGQVCGAKIAGSLSSVGLKHMGAVSGYGFLFSPFASRIADREQKRETRYRDINPLCPDFLAADKANFRYGSLEVDHVAVSEEYKTLESGYNASGGLEIHLREGKTRKFWLTCNANPAAVAELFRKNGIRVEAKGGSVSSILAR